MKKSKLRVRSWNQLAKISKKLNIGGEINYFIPEGVHGLKDTKVIIDANDEIKQELDFYEENKWSDKGSIILIG
jgi:hypothetical protein